MRPDATWSIEEFSSLHGELCVQDLSIPACDIHSAICTFVNKEGKVLYTNQSPRLLNMQSDDLLKIKASLRIAKFDDKYFVYLEGERGFDY
jgi:hypothetical protein